MPYFLIIAASILLLISIIGTGYNEGYGIAVAVVAGVVASLALVASYKAEVKFAAISIVSFWSSLSLILFMKEDRPPYCFSDSIYLLILLYSIRIFKTYDDPIQYIAYLLLIWNGVAAIILTFNGPFIATTNGVSCISFLPLECVFK